MSWPWKNHIQWAELYQNKKQSDKTINPSFNIPLFKDKGLTNVLNWSLLAGLGMSFMIGLFYSMDSVPGSILSIFFFVFIVMFENVRKPAGVSYISDLADKKILSTSLSVESQVKGFFAAILAPALGFLIDQIGLGEGLMVLALVLIVIFPIVRIVK